MATGDLIVFDEAKKYMLDGGWEAADDIKCAVMDNTTTPTAAFATPAFADFTEVTDAGTYTIGGTSLGTWTSMMAEATGVLTHDSATNPTWAQDGSNDVDAWWGILYNDTDGGKRAYAFVELGGPVDMTAGDLTITWNGTGIFTLT